MVPTALRRRRSTIGAAGVFLLLTAGCTAVGKPGPPPVLRAPVGVQHGQTLAGPLLGRTGARLTVGDAASTVHVRLAELPGQLYRITTPAGGGLTARVTGPDGRVDVGLRPDGDQGPDAVAIVLNRAVRWDIRLPAGAGEARLDLRRGRLARVEVGASGLAVLNLPQPRGVVPITLTDAVGSVRVAAPEGTAVRRVRGPDAEKDRYVIIARAGVGDLTLDH
jgi:hypothetical protein